MNQPLALSPELDLLAACDLAPAGVLLGKLEGARAAGLDWRRFADLAEGNGLAGLAMARLWRDAPGAVPADIEARFAGLVRGGAITHLAQGRTTVRLTRILAQAGIRSIVLKGQALSHMLYQPEPHWRSSSDIDILISPASLETADRVLRDNGFVRQWPEQDPPRRGRDMFLLLANVFDYVCRESGQLVELHHRITLNPRWLPGTFEDLYAASSEVETGQGTIRGLDGPLLVAYLCWHALSHFNFRLKWVGDIARALRHVASRSCTELCPPAAGFAQGPLTLADALLRVILPSASGAGMPGKAGGWRTQVGRIVAGMEDPVRFPTRRSFVSLPREFAFRLFLSRLSPGLAGKSYEVLRGLTDTRDVTTLRLGAAFAPLYALAGPALAMTRLARRDSGEPDRLD